MIITIENRETDLQTGLVIGSIINLTQYNKFMEMHHAEHVKPDVRYLLEVIKITPTGFVYKQTTGNDDFTPTRRMQKGNFISHERFNMLFNNGLIKNITICNPL